MTLLSYSRTYATSREAAYQALIDVNLPDVLGHRSLVIPGIKETRPGPTGWGSLGDVRTVVLNDGATSREELVVVDPPAKFGYRITELTGALALLVGSIDGLFAFEDDGSGTRVTWSWDLHPRGLQGRAAMPVFGPIWRRWAAGCFDRLEPLLATPA